jgi:hypothetical protein
MTGLRLEESFADRMASRKWMGLGGLAVLGLSLACSPTPAEKESESVSKVTQALTGSHQLKIPEWTLYSDFALAATNTLRVNSRARVVGLVTNTGTGATTLGTQAQTGPIISVGPVTVGGSARVDGEVRSASSVTLGTGAVVGPVTSNTPIPTRTRSISVDFGSGALGAVTVAGGTTQSRAPGSYTDVLVRNAGTLALASGTYFFSSLTLETGSRVTLAGSGPVYLFVRTNLILRGTVTPPVGNSPPLLIAALGTTAIPVESPGFSGTLLAPNTKLNITAGGPFTGQAFAKDIELFADRLWTLQPLSVWNQVLDPLPDTNPTMAGTETLSSLLPSNAVGTAIMNFVNAGFNNANNANILNALTALNAQPPAQVATAFTNAFRATPNPMILYAVVSTAAAWAKPEALPLFSEVLSPSQVPPASVLASLNAHDRRLINHASVALAAIRGLGMQIRAGTTAARPVLMTATTTHPIRAVRRAGVFEIMHFTDAALRTELSSKISAADRPWLNLRRAVKADWEIGKDALPIPTASHPVDTPSGGVTGVPPISPDPECTEATATDMGGPGHNVTVPNDGCLRVRDAYPTWWATRNMRLEVIPTGTYPTPFTWSNSCTSSGGSGTFTQDWQMSTLSVTSRNCATVIDLQGSGNGSITIRYWGD